MFRKAENVFATILSDVTKLTSALPGVGIRVNDTNLEIGAVVLVNAGYERTTYAALDDGDTYFILQGKGEGQPLKKSPAIVKGTETFSTAAHIPAVQQITAIGFNGTTGALPDDNETSFYVKVRKNDNDAANRSQPFSLFAQYKTSGAATQEEVAFGIVTNGIKNMSLEPANGYLRYEALIDDAGAAITGPATYDVTYGSRTVTGNAAITAGLVAGDILLINDVAYKVETVAGAIVTLTFPYQGETGTLAAAVVLGVAAATAAAADWGIRLRGVVSNFDVNAFRNYYSNRFTASFSDSDALITHLQGASEGLGTWERVALDEYMSYGFDGQNDMLGVPPRNRDQEVKIPGRAGLTKLDTKYSVLNIKWRESVDGLVSKSGAEGNVLVYLNLEDDSGSGVLLTNPVNTGGSLAVAFGFSTSDFAE